MQKNLLELHNVAYIPSMRRNFISIPILDRLGYTFLFRTGKVKLYRDSILIDIEVLCGSLYNKYSIFIVNTICNSKRLSLNEKSYTI